MATSSAGISIKDILNNSQSDPLDANNGFLHSSSNSKEEHLDSCFYDLCIKKKSCGGYITCGKFRSSVNSLLCCFFTLLTFCVFTAVIGPLVLYSFADEEVNTQVVIDSTSAPAYDLWHTNRYGDGYEDIKITYDMHFFDCQNVEEAQTGAKPVLVEVGPYAFDEYFEKFDISWSDGGDTVTYYTYRYYLFNQERSGPGLFVDDGFQIPYPSVAGFQYILKDLPVDKELLIEEAVVSVLEQVEDAADYKFQSLENQINDSPILGPKAQIALGVLNVVETLTTNLFDNLFLFVNQSNPTDLLLKYFLCGTPDGPSLFYTGHPVTAWFGNVADPLLLQVSKVVEKIEAKTGQDIPWTASVPANSWNWSDYDDVRRRRSKDVFKTGKKNSHQVGQYVSYNGMKIFYNCVAPMDSQVPGGYIEGEQFPGCAYFDQNWTEEEAEEQGYVRPFYGEHANRIEGTDGNMFGRPVTSENIQIFSYDIYRTGYMGFRGEVYDWHGVKLRRYGIREKDTYNSSVIPANADYYAFGWYGVENLTICQNLPVFVSFPHFLYADSRYVENLVGMNPSADAHDSYVDVEPQTGMLARAAKRIQVNYQLFDTTLPELNQATIDQANYICGNLSTLASLLAGVVEVPTCNATIPVELLSCLNTPSQWSFNGGSIMVPMGWVQEGVTMPKSSADELNDLYMVDDAASELRFWCLVIAGVSAGMILLLFYSQYNFDKQRGIDKSQYRLVHTDTNSIANPVGSAPLLEDKF